MKALLQRCRHARVEVEGSVVGQIQMGLTIFLGVEAGDTLAQAEVLARKIAALRVFPDDAGRMNLGLREVGGAALVISNFTLCASTRKGTRPGFGDAAPPETARMLYEAFATLLESQAVAVSRGSFGADMRVLVENDGPVCLNLEARSLSDGPGPQ